MAKAIVKAVAYYNDPKILAQVSENLPKAMKGLEISQIPDSELLASRGW